jgi:hypothetical protein
MAFLRRPQSLVFAARKPVSRRPRFDPLEDRTLPSISATLTGAVSLEVGANVNVSRQGGNQEETSVALNPTNPAQVFVVSNNDYPTPGLFAASSTDAGATWTRTPTFGTGPVAHGGDGLPAACCDPETSWDQFGNLFLTYLGQNDDVELLLSTNGGRSFTVAATVTDAKGSGPDQPAIATGAGSVWISYTDSGTALRAFGARVTGLGQVGPFSTPELVTGSAATTGAFGGIAIGPKGQVLVTYQPEAGSAGPAPLFVNLDPDGLGPQGFGAQREVLQTNVGDQRQLPAVSNNFGIDAEANLAWDRSGGPHNGRVYLVYTDAANTTTNDTNIFAVYSDDNGGHWSSPVRVNDDTGTNSQFLPSIAVDQSTGNVGIAWYDARNDLGNHGPGDTDGVPNTDAEMFAAVSTDGGQTFSTNVQLSAAPSNAAASEPPAPGNRPLGYGDFQTSDYAAGTFYGVSADNSNSTGDNPDGARSKLDVYATRLTVGLETVTVKAAPGNNRCTIRLDPSRTYVDFYQNTPTTGAPTFIAALGALKNITVEGGTGDDQLTIDFRNGNPIPAGGLGYDGGTGGNSRLVLEGGSFTNESYSPSGAAAGTVTLDGSTVIFAKLLAVTDTVAATNFTVNGRAGADTIDVLDAGTVNGVHGAEVHGGTTPTFAKVDFANKSNLTVHANAGDDTVRVTSLTGVAGLATVTLTGGDGNDTFIVTPSATIPFTVHGGKLIPPATPGDTLDLNLAGITGAQLNLTQPTPANGLAGTWTFANARPITFDSMETVPVGPGQVGAVGEDVRGVEGQSAGPVTVAAFTGPGSPSDYTVTILWGDGSSGPAMSVALAPDGHSFLVQASHSYTEEGNYQVHTSISHGSAPKVAVSSTARIADNVGILLLDVGARPALNVSGAGTVTVDGGGAIAVNSAISVSAVDSGSGSVKAAEMDVGGSPGVQRTGTGTLPSDLTVRATATPDPFAFLAPPTLPPAGFPGASTSFGSVTLSPGRYAGPITVSGTAVVTLLPGTYYLQGGLSVSGFGQVSGSGVLLYNAPTGSTGITVTDGGRVNLSAQTSGPFLGMALWQARGSSVPVTVSGKGSVCLTGSLFAPSAAVSIGGKGAVLSLQGSRSQGLAAHLVAADLLVSEDGSVSVDASNNDPAPPSRPKPQSTSSPSAGSTGPRTAAAQSPSSGGASGGQATWLAALYSSGAGTPFVAASPTLAAQGHGAGQTTGVAIPCR